MTSSSAPRGAVVTGASSGIGAATVRELRRRGWEVVGIARREDRLRELADETGTRVFAADLTKQDEVDALAAFVRDEVPHPVSALVNVTGGALGMGTVEDGDPDDWARMFDINVLATKRVVGALLPLLRLGVADAGVADLMTVTSIAGHVAYEGGGGYNAAKYAERAMTEVLRLELGGEPIRVVEIAPGMVRTEEFSLTRFGGDQERADKVYEGVVAPLTAEDIAGVIAHTLELPGHVNIDTVTIKPVAQVSPQRVVRGELKVKGA